MAMFDFGRELRRWFSDKAEPPFQDGLTGGEPADLDDFAGKHRLQMAADIDDQPVFLAKTAWETGYVAERYPKVRFERSKERA